MVRRQGACEGGIPEFPTYPPVSRFMEIPAGTSLMLENPVQAIKGGFLTMDGEKASPTFEDPVHFGSIPTEPGKYALEVHVALDGDNGAHGSATFWFGVDVVPIAPPTASPDPPASASPAGDVSDVLRISCGGDGTRPHPSRRGWAGWRPRRAPRRGYQWRGRSTNRPPEDGVVLAGRGVSGSVACG